MTPTVLADAIDAVLLDEPDLVKAVARAWALDSHADRDFALAEVFEKALYRALARNPGLAATGPGTLVHSLQLALTRKSALVFAREFTAVLNLDRNRILASALDPARVLPVPAALLDAVSAIESTRDLGTRRIPYPATPMSAMSRRLTAWAVRLLPARHRQRCDEEYRSELYNLGCDKQAQLRYAIRVLVHTPQLRRELRR